MSDKQAEAAREQSCLAERREREEYIRVMEAEQQGDMQMAAEAEAARQQLHDAAEELFDLADVCDEFHDLTETRQGQAVLKQLSMTAGKYIANGDQFLCDITDADRELCAALAWRDAPIADCLVQAERIAETIEEG